MKRVYISGPMAGVPEHNFPEFQKTADLYRAQGFDVVSPHESFDGDTTSKPCAR